MSAPRTRDFRRAQDKRSKRRTKRTRKLWSARAGYQPGEDTSIDDPAINGHLAAVGCRPCNGSCCVSDDNYPTRQEARAQVSEREQRAEARHV